jgi:hypothetical protein
MAAGPPVQPGQLSPDGLWRWDGVQWVRATPGVSPMPAPRRSNAWIWWLAGGCVVLTMLGFIGAGFGIYGLVRGFQSGGFTCLPSDFPSYPNVTVANEQTRFGTGVAPGDTNECRMVLDSNDNVTTVTGYYKQQLNSGDWITTSSDLSSGVISFQLASRPQTIGTVSLLARGQHTEIRIVLDS